MLRWCLVTRLDFRCAKSACCTPAVQIRSSRRLRRVAQTVLMVGNAVNIGTAHGNADGIRLDSLLKLADVKVSASPWPAILHWAGALPLLVSVRVGSLKTR